jgi:uncharacterized protein YfaQ (DUF2300 family)
LLLLLSFAAPAAGVPRDAACVERPDLAQWLARQRSRWEARLNAEPGYEAVAPQVCQLQARRPYADVTRRRLYVAALANANDEVALVHEYLHLALAHHPHGRDEAYVEALARELVQTHE